MYDNNTSDCVYNNKISTTVFIFYKFMYVQDSYTVQKISSLPPPPPQKLTIISILNDVRIKNRDLLHPKAFIWS